MARRRYKVREHRAGSDISLWKEARCGADFLLLHMSPAYYGLGIPHGDDSAVVVIPGFLENDFYLTHLRSWLRQIGYRAYDSGIGLNAECPNLLIKQRLVNTIRKAVSETGHRVHLIGHSLGGILARSVAVQRPDDIASVITLGSPFRGTVVHHSVFRAAESVRRNILKEHGRAVFPTCFTPRCNCEFRKSLCRPMPASVNETAIYTRNDGVVDWHYCRTGDREIDFEVPGTHVGLVFNPSVYTIIASRLAKPICPKPTRCRLRAPVLSHDTTRRPVPSITPATIPAVCSSDELHSARSETGDQRFGTGLKQPDPGANLTAYRKSLSENYDRQIRLLRNVKFWYLLPPYVGILMAVMGTWWRRAAHGMSFRNAPIVICLVTVVFALAWIANEVIGVRYIQRLKRELSCLEEDRD
jgi:triacylglycerol lipase